MCKFASLISYNLELIPTVGRTKAIKRLALWPFLEIAKHNHSGQELNHGTKFCLVTIHELSKSFKLLESLMKKQNKILWTQEPTTTLNF